MQVEILMDAKRQMDNEIMNAITVAVEKFEQETGYTPASVDIYLSDMTSIGDTKKRYVVTGVKTSVYIFAPDELVRFMKPLDHPDNLP